MGRLKRVEEQLERIEAVLVAIRRNQQEMLSWKEIALQMQREKRDLLDRLMARSLQELKTCQLNGIVQEKVKVEYNPAQDMENLGSVVE